MNNLGENNINILMLGVSYRNVAIPLMFRMLDKRGNSNTQEHMALMQDFMDWCGRNYIDCFLADREFVCKEWLGFLNENHIAYPIRIRNNFKVFLPSKQETIKVSHLFNRLKINECEHYRHMVEMHGELFYLSAIKILKNGKVEFLLLVSFNRPEHALAYYRLRGQIDILFKGMKTSGFNIEDIHVTALDRLEKLIMLIMLAFI